MTARTILDSQNVGAYLQSRNHLDARSRVAVEPLGGGVSNTVLRITQGDDCLVVKQPLSDLAVDEEWLADLDRVHNEATAARAYKTVLTDSRLDNVHVPDVLFEDAANHVLGIECAPVEAAPWKTTLLTGAVDPAIAGRLGAFLGTSHSMTEGNETLAARFTNDAPFRQLRLDPYHRTVARRHRDLAALIHEETDRISTVARTLVHGDFSPKNVLIREAGVTPELWILDFEVAHWGDPCFDVAFMLNHLLLKAVARPQERQALLAAAREFLARYTDRVPWAIEAETIRELALLLLARVDGKSPVEYITAESTKEQLRSVGRTALRTETETLAGFIALLLDEVHA